MPPKRSLAPASSPPQRGLISSFCHGIKSPENASVVRSVTVFVVAAVFLSSSWTDYLLPPLQCVDGAVKAEDSGAGDWSYVMLGGRGCVQLPSMFL
ncbi:hypothetical protein C7212DRAFT_325520 [Tuber magnatum]|uniref:Uncharacterized protein n=1 Tax=Tuber magnatum TaxID=42249 RepID=A0A317SRA9_9PEZI|nr:hypothetical protein C7212DRAFT_325520 [Tuber magnatum]